MNTCKCPKCNSEIGNWDFCFYCGENLKKRNNSDSQEVFSDKNGNEIISDISAINEAISTDEKGENNSPKKCPQCDKEIGEWDFCFYCGANLKNFITQETTSNNATNENDIKESVGKEAVSQSEPETNLPIKKCPKCGREIGEWAFCFHCGANLKDQDSLEPKDFSAENDAYNDKLKDIDFRLMCEQIPKNESNDNKSENEDLIHSDSESNFEQDIPNDNIIVLTDEEGNEAEFEFLDLIAYRGKEYVVFLPNDETADEVIILEFEESVDGTEHYSSVENDYILQVIFEIFKQRAGDKFNFVD